MTPPPSTPASKARVPATAPPRSQLEVPLLSDPSNSNSGTTMSGSYAVPIRPTLSFSAPLPSLQHPPSESDPPRRTSRLEALPIELQYHITSYLSGPFSMRGTGLCTKQSDLDLYNRRINFFPHSRHPFLTLTATSKTLRTVVDSYCALLVNKHMLRERSMPPPSEKQSEWPARRQWLWKTYRLCIFCGHPTARLALFNRTIKCCAKCDKKEWEKVTMTDCIKKYDLSKPHLFEHPLRPKHTVYMVSGQWTTMFIRSEIEAFAEVIHGDFKAHDAERQARKVKRQAKIRENRERHSSVSAGWMSSSASPASVG